MGFFFGVPTLDKLKLEKREDVESSVVCSWFPQAGVDVALGVLCFDVGVAKYDRPTVAACNSSRGTTNSVPISSMIIGDEHRFSPLVRR